MKRGTLERELKVKSKVTVFHGCSYGRAKPPKAFQERDPNHLGSIPINNYVQTNDLHIPNAQKCRKSASWTGEST